MRSSLRTRSRCPQRASWNSIRIGSRAVGHTAGVPSPQARAASPAGATSGRASAQRCMRCWRATPARPAQKPKQELWVAGVRVHCARRERAPWPLPQSKYRRCALQEEMSSGTAAIVRRSRGARRAVAQTERTGMLSTCGQTAQWRGALQCLPRIRRRQSL